VRRLIRWAASLYPASWRQRYGGELEALLDDLEPRWRDLWNVTLGAIIMQIRHAAVIPVALGLAGVVAGVIVAAARPSLYQSSATIRFADEDPLLVRSVLEAAFDGGSQPGGGRVHPARVQVLIDERRSARTESVRTVRLMTADEDAASAQRNTQYFVDRIAAQKRPSGSAWAETVIPPTLPTAPDSPNRVALAEVGGALGLLVGAAVTWLRRRRRAIQ